MTRLVGRNTYRLFLAIVVCGLLGCQSIRANNAEKTNINSAITRGEVRLTCKKSCSKDWDAVQNYAHELFDAGGWASLANIVIRVGYDSDQTYFYLGRAAEASGFFSAAKTYYQLGLESNNHCQPIGAGCNGIDVQQQLKLRTLMIAPAEGIADPSIRCMDISRSLSYIKTNYQLTPDLSGNQLDPSGMSVLISAAIKYKNNRTISSGDVALDVSKYANRQGTFNHQVVPEVISRLGQKSATNIWKNYSENNDKKRSIITLDARHVPVMVTELTGDRIYLLYPNGQICTTPTARFLDKAESRPFWEILD